MRRNEAFMVIKNILRNIQPVIMGEDSFPVIVSNVGITARDESFHDEAAKATAAVKAGADIISDLSMVPNISELHKWYVDNVDCPLSCVAVYETYLKTQHKKVDSNQFIKDFEEQAIRGVDLITLHATVHKNDIDLIRSSQRLIPVTSRGGTMMLDCMIRNGYENPYYEFFDEVLKIALKYHVCISLGPMYRPASVWDCACQNELHLLEIERMADLVKKAQHVGVGIAVEGIGHAPISQIPSLVLKSKHKCNNAPYRVLSVATDVAMGFDHISSAIASAVAVQYGADSITCVTRDEHLGKPSVNSIIESVYAARVAAEVGYRSRKGTFPLDYSVSSARRNMGCHASSDAFMFSELIPAFPSENRDKKSCGMCGDYCPFMLLDNM